MTREENLSTQLKRCRDRLIEANTRAAIAEHEVALYRARCDDLSEVIKSLTTIINDGRG